MGELLKHETTDEMIRRVGQGIKKENFEFCVEVRGIPYDVYWFTEKGIVGQLAFAIIDGTVEIAMFKAGRMNADEVTAYLTEEVEA